MNNLYIQTLKLGFENPDGISLNEVVERLDINLFDDVFKTNYIYWFYENFYNSSFEKQIEEFRFSYGPREMIFLYNRIDLLECGDTKSYIKGDTVNKYIDYLELERTRQTSKQASYFATGSIIIAILAVILPYLINPEDITVSGKVSLLGIILTLFSFGYSYFSVANAKSDTVANKKSFWTYSIIMVVLGLVLGFLIITLLNKVVLNVSLVGKGLLVLPVLVFVIGQIWRKYKL